TSPWCRPTFPWNCSTLLRKQLRDRYAEARQELLVGQDLPVVQDRHLHEGAVDEDATQRGVHHPHNLCARGEIVAKLLLQPAHLIVWRENLHDQLGRDLEISLRPRPEVALLGDEEDVDRAHRIGVPANVETHTTAGGPPAP